MVKEYTTEDARNFMKKITILLGLNSENIPDEIDLFYQMLITSVLNVYSEELIFQRIENAAKGIIDIDMKFYNKPISIIWFIELCKSSRPGFQQ